MSGWRAIVPVRFGTGGKTRLAERLSPAEREHLVEAMARHVVARLAASAAIVESAVLSPAPPPFSGTAWLRDRGLGLNPELAAALGGGERVVVIHADLPWLETGDIDRLLGEAESHGAAIAPDRAGSGTNALALKAAEGFRPCFGRDSFARHRAALPRAAVVRRVGLANDVDTPGDLERAFGSPGLALGWEEIAARRTGRDSKPPLC